MKARKVKEAEECIAKAEKRLETGFFKRNADYFGAAPLFAEAAKNYEVAEDVKLASDLYLRSAECELKSGALYACGEKTERAALLLGRLKKDATHRSRSVALYREACSRFRECDQHEKGAQCLMKASALLDESDASAVLTLLEEVLDIYDNNVTTEFSIDPYRRVLNLYVSEKRWKESISIAKRMASAFVRINQPHNVYKCFLTVTILYLAYNDFVAAQAAFQEHLQDSSYLRSKECETEEMLLQCFNDNDEEKLEEMRSGTRFNFLDHQVIKVAKKLTTNPPEEAAEEEEEEDES